MKTLILPIFVMTNIFSVLAHAQMEFQKNSETAVEETEEIQEGKRTRTIRSGKVKQRKGGPRVGDIEDDEVAQLERRQKTHNMTAFGFGPFASGNIGKGTTMYGASFGYHWETTTTSEIVAEVLGAANGHGSFANLGLGLNWMPSTGSVSPLLGAEFGFGYGQGKNSSDESVSKGGFSYQANLGLRFFRLSEVQMELMGTYTGTFTNPTPHIYGVQLRVLY